MSSPTLGQVIKHRLENIGMSKAELARRLNMSSANVHKILKRSTVDIELLRKISDAIGYDFIAHYRYATNPAQNVFVSGANGANSKPIDTYRLRIRILELTEVTRRLLAEDPVKHFGDVRADVALMEIILNDIWKETTAYDKARRILDQKIGEQSHSCPQNRIEQTKNG